MTKEKAHFPRKSKKCAAKNPYKQNARRHNKNSLRYCKDSAALLFIPGMVAKKNRAGILTQDIYANSFTHYVHYSNGSCAGFEPASPFTLLSLQLFKPQFKTDYSIVFDYIMLLFLCQSKRKKSSFCIKDRWLSVDQP